MSLIKTSITIPEDIFNEAKKRSGNFSSLVTEALNNYLRKVKIQKALESFGSWEEREEKSVSIVNELRSDTGRDYADRDS